MYYSRYFLLILFIANCLVFSTCSSYKSREIYSNPLINGREEFTEEENKALDAVSSDRFYKLIGWKHNPKRPDYSEITTSFCYLDSDEPDKDVHNKTTFLARHLLIEHLVFRDRYADNYKYDLRSLIDDGYLAYIPRNPYTGEDIKSSFEYSPGDCFVAVDGRGFLQIFHMGDRDPLFDPYRTEADGLTFERSSLESVLCNDGHSLFHIHRYSPEQAGFRVNALQRNQEHYFYKKNTPEYRKIFWLHRQVYRIMSEYSYLHDDVPETLDDCINYFGRMNSAAWINPYTKQPMQNVGFARSCEYYLSNRYVYHGTPITEDVLSEKTDINYFAGNYSFATFETEKGPNSVFAVYYLNIDNKLCASICRAVPKSRAFSDLWYCVDDYVGM